MSTAATEVLTAAPAPSMQNFQELRDLLVTAVRLESAGVISLELSDPAGGALPAWTPGAHIDLVLPSGLVRQYSLCGEASDSRSYRIAVLRENDGRGGSREIHDSMLVGRTLKFRGPRNHFPLEPAERYLFIAGGIGVTPILAMVRSLDATTTHDVVYGGRTRATMAFIDELAIHCRGRLEIVPQDERGLIDLARIADDLPADTAVYCCGPEPLLEAVRSTFESSSPGRRVHFERFSSSGAPAAAPPTDDEAASEFEVELRRTGCTLTVGPDKSLIDVIRQACPDVMSSCEEGFCGTCETRVLEGEPDHRDTILSDRERQEGRTMMICVGRSRSARLVLDL